MCIKRVHREFNNFCELFLYSVFYINIVLLFLCKFTGKEFDTESGLGLFYFGARYYDPDLGVWTATDPMDQYWNAYSYCGADPVNYVDEWGLEGDEGVPGFSIPGYLGNNHFGDDVNVNGISPTETGPGSVNNPDQNREGPPTIVSNNSFVDNLREAYKRQQAAYGKEGVEADPFIPSPVLVAPVVGKAGKNIVKAADDVVEDVLNAGKNFADDLTKAGKGGTRKSITEKPNAGKNANGSKSKMLGKNPNLEKIDDKYLKKNGIDAHDLKMDYLGKKVKISSYDLFKDKNTGQVFIVGTKGDAIGKSIPTKVFIK